MKKMKKMKKMVGMLIPKGASVKLHIDGGDLMEQTTNNWVRSSNKHVSIGDNVEGKVEERFYRSGSKISGYKFKKIVKIPEGLVGHVYTSNKGTNFIEVDPEAIQLIESEPTKGTGATEEASGEAGEASGATVSPVLPGAKTGATVTPAATTATGSTAETEGATGATEEAGAVVAAVVAAAATEEAGEATAQGATAETVAVSGEAGEAGAAATATSPPPVELEEVKLEVKGGGSQRLTRKNKKSIGTVRKTRTNH